MTGPSAASRDGGGLRRADLLWILALIAVIGFLLFHNFARGGGAFSELRLGPLRLSIFGLLAALDMLFGVYLVYRWCERFDLDWPTLSAGLPWIIVAGYFLSHLVSIALYFPEELTNLGALLDPRTRISSFGGIFGGGIVALFYLRRKGLSIPRYLDALTYGFVGGYIFGRAGCFAIHDHPGAASDSFLAVPIAGVRRHDLGFYEMWLMLALAIAITLLARRERPADGRVFAFATLVYAPIRFFLDSLRIADATYGGLTPGQWLSIPLLALGLVALRHSAKATRRSAS